MKDSERVSLASLIPYIRSSDLRSLAYDTGTEIFDEELEKRDGELRQVSEHVVRFNDDALRVLSQDI